jgi:hypothetical protein
MEDGCPNTPARKYDGEAWSMQDHTCASSIVHILPPQGGSRTCGTPLQKSPT